MGNACRLMLIALALGVPALLASLARADQEHLERIRQRLSELVLAHRQLETRPVYVEYVAWDTPTGYSTSVLKTPGSQPAGGSTLKVWLGVRAVRENIDLAEPSGSGRRFHDMAFGPEARWSHLDRSLAGADAGRQGGPDGLDRLAESSRKRALLHLDGGLSYVGAEPTSESITISRVDDSHWTGQALQTVQGRKWTLRMSGRLGTERESDWLTTVQSFKPDASAPAVSIVLSDWQRRGASGVLSAGLVDVRSSELKLLQRLDTVETATPEELGRVLRPPTRDGRDAVRGAVTFDSYTWNDAQDASSRQPVEHPRRGVPSPGAWPTTWVVGISGAALVVAVTVLVWTRRRS